jgi:hypothetical protein
MATRKTMTQKFVESQKKAKAWEPPVTDYTENPTQWKIDYSAALNHYSRETDSKQQKQMAFEYFTLQGKNFKSLNKLADWNFTTLGSVCRILTRGVECPEYVTEYVEKTYLELIEKARKVAEPTPTSTKVVAPVVNIQDKIREKAGEIAVIFDELYDDFVFNDVEVKVKPASILKSHQVSAPVAKIIPSFYTKQIAELEEVLEGSCPQLKEGYGHIKKTKVKKMVALLKEWVEACGEKVVLAKTERKPRKRKEKPATQVVAKLKYKKEDTELGIKSVSPTEIVNALEVWVFNTKYRKLQVYRALDSSGMSVRGTTLLNFDPATSGSKTIRKPETVKDFAGMTKRTLNSAYKAVKCKEAQPNGRINEECILLKVFS